MRTVGWHNWQPSGGNMSQSFGGVTVTLRAGGEGGTVSLMGKKTIVVHGVTLGADAAIATGGKSAVMEVHLEGLASGAHTFVGYHHALGGDAGTYTVSASGRRAEGVKPSEDARHNDEVGTSFIEFEAQAGQPAVIRIAATSGNRVLLSGFALDVTDPHKKALKPLPADYERHADGDGGKVNRTWTPSDSAAGEHIYMVSDLDPEAAERKLVSATQDSEGFLASVKGGSYSAPIVANNSLLHYAWRVDSVDAEGNVTRGDVWHFRVRHLAFPTAEGYGRFAIGGRGGRVIHVTNLNDSGPGSLREAVEATGPRTVVSDVSGLISLKSKLVFHGANQFLTIAGQTAPGKGICIRNYTFGGIGGRDTILRFVRLRLGNLSGKTMDGMGFASCDHCIIDHCSISWSIDEAFSARGAKNSTFHHNLWACNTGRNPSVGMIYDFTFANNVVFNWRHRTVDGGDHRSFYNIINNYFKPGPITPQDRPARHRLLKPESRRAKPPVALSPPLPRSAGIPTTEASPTRTPMATGWPTSGNPSMALTHMILAMHRQISTLMATRTSKSSSTEPIRPHRRLEQEREVLTLISGEATRILEAVWSESSGTHSSRIRAIAGGRVKRPWRIRHDPNHHATHHLPRGIMSRGRSHWAEDHA